MSYTDTFRTSRFLRRTRGVSTPVNLMFFDCESVPMQGDTNPRHESHRLRLWCASALRLEGNRATRIHQSSGTSADSFWRMVYSRLDVRRPLWIFSHNLGFDLTLVDTWRMVADGKLDFVQERRTLRLIGDTKGKRSWRGTAILSDPPTVLRCRRHGTRLNLTMIDTFNYWRCSLAELGQSLGIPKRTMPDFSAPDSAWEEYCWRDVEIIECAVRNLMALVRQEGLGKWAFTGAGQSWEAYRTKFLKTDHTILIHGCRDAIDLERKAYYGGAVQCFFVGSVIDRSAAAPDRLWADDAPRVRFGPVYHLDVRSFYPSMMSRRKYPAQLLRYHVSPSVKYITDTINDKGWIATVDIETDAPGYPVRRNGKMFYAVGRFRTYLAGPELQRAFRMNHVRSVWSAAEYHMEELFTDYVDYFRLLREGYEKAGNCAFAEMAKLLMNSLYGKFAQKGASWVDDADAIAPVPLGYFFEKQMGEKEITLYRSMGWLAQKHEESGEGKKSCPAISAYVTAYGREHMLALIMHAGMSNVWYSDTDSIICNEAGYQRLANYGLVRDKAFGLLRVVKVGARAEFRGLKDYSIDGDDVIAGVSKSAERIGPRRYRQLKFPRLSVIFSLDGWDSVQVARQEIVCADAHVPGSIEPDGTVLPVRIEEW